MVSEAHYYSVGMPGHLEMLVILAIVAVTVLPFWLIFDKAGFPGALSLLMLFPLLNLVMLFFLAFADWPALRRDEEEVVENRP